MNPQEQYLTVRQAAEQLGVGVHCVRRYIQRGVIQNVVKMEGATSPYLIPPTEIEAVKRDRPKPGNPNWVGGNNKVINGYVESLTSGEFPLTFAVEGGNRDTVKRRIVAAAKRAGVEIEFIPSGQESVVVRQKAAPVAVAS